MLGTRYSVLRAVSTRCKSIEVSDRTHTNSHTDTHLQSSCGCLAAVNLGLVWGLTSGLGTGTVGHALRRPRNQISKSVLHTLWRLCQGLLTLVLDTTQLNSTQLNSTPAQMDAPGQANDKVNVKSMRWQQKPAGGRPSPSYSSYSYFSNASSSHFYPSPPRQQSHKNLLQQNKLRASGAEKLIDIRNSSIAGQVDEFSGSAWHLECNFSTNNNCMRITVSTVRIGWISL